LDVVFALRSPALKSAADLALIGFSFSRFFLTDFLVGLTVLASVCGWISILHSSLHRSKPGFCI
jgi:hypothetical protein